MSPVRLFPALLLFLPVLWPQVVAAHGSVHERLAAVERQLAAKPDDPALLLHRARLHHEHGDTEAALQDLRAVGRLDPTLTDRWFVEARIHLDTHQRDRALDAVQRLLGQHPASVAGLALRSRIHEENGDAALAIRDAREVIRFAPEPTLQQHLRLVVLLETHGSRKDISGAFAIARQSVGPMPLLLQRQADWLAAIGDREGASAVYSELREQVPTLAFSLFVDEARLWLDHDQERARTAMEKAENAWAQLSPVVRNRAAMRAKHHELPGLRTRVSP